MIKSGTAIDLEMVSECWMEYSRRASMIVVRCWWKATVVRGRLYTNGYEKARSAAEGRSHCMSS